MKILASSPTKKVRGHQKKTSHGKSTTSPPRKRSMKDSLSCPKARSSNPSTLITPPPSAAGDSTGAASHFSWPCAVIAHSSCSAKSTRSKPRWCRRSNPSGASSISSARSTCRTKRPWRAKSQSGTLGPGSGMSAKGKNIHTAFLISCRYVGPSVCAFAPSFFFSHCYSFDTILCTGFLGAL